jgi:hypothetical protein
MLALSREDLLHFTTPIHAGADLAQGRGTTRAFCSHSSAYLTPLSRCQSGQIGIIRLLRSLLAGIGVHRQTDRTETQIPRPLRQATSIQPLLLGVRVIHHSVEATEQEDSREARVVYRPCVRVNAGLKQLGEMIDDDVVDQALSRCRTRPVESQVVQKNQVEMAVDAGVRPRGKSSAPISFPRLGKR